MKIYDTKYGTFLLEEGDLISDCLIRGEFWEEELKSIFDQYLNKSSVVIEVGSYIGDHTVYLSKLCKKIYAFEGTTENYYQLCANLLLNKCNNVEASNILVGREVGMWRHSCLEKEDPYPDIPNNKAGVVFIQDSSGDIYTESLDNCLFYLDGLDLIKTDVEGMDLEVLYGAESLIEEFRPLILFEYNAPVSKQPLEDYIKFLERFGYTCTQLSKWNWMAI